tara:strand:+ start:185 stop:499 length:315 start_codon:yes stop_codon:yes gene_type:complete
LERNPVIHTPNPNRAKAKTAKVCSFMIRRTNIKVNDRNPGTSLRLCKIPISTPVKAAFSTTKLFNIADQALKATGIAIDMRINKEIGLINPFLKTISFIFGTGY